MMKTIDYYEDNELPMRDLIARYGVELPLGELHSVRRHLTSARRSGDCPRLRVPLGEHWAVIVKGLDEYCLLLDALGGELQ